LAIEITLVGVMVNVPKIGVSEAPTPTLFTEGLLPLYTINLMLSTIKASILGKSNTPWRKKKHMTHLLVNGHENDPSSKDLQGTKAGGKKHHKPIC
jgi:hypothetical protein